MSKKRGRKSLACVEFRKSAPFLHGAALLVVAVPTAGKTHFCRHAQVAGKGVRLSDGDDVVAARRGWPKDWQRTEKGKANQARAMYEAYVEHALEYPRIPIVGSIAKGGLPALAAYYGCIVLRRASMLELEVGAARRWMAATQGGHEHREWAGKSVDDVKKRIADAYASQDWHAQHVDFVFDTWKQLAARLGLWLPPRYTEDISEKDKTMAEKMWGVLTIGGATYKVHGDQKAIDQARQLLAAPSGEAVPQGIPGQDAKAVEPAKAPEPKPPSEGDIRKYAHVKKAPLPDPERWTDVVTPKEARK